MIRGGVGIGGKVTAFIFLLSMAAGLSGAPNVLLVIADDLGTDSLSGFNSNSGVSLPPTPTLDNLRQQGLAFSRFTAYATCSPTRAALMTGRHAFRTGVFSPEGATLKINDFTLPEALIASGRIGERLACIGKWHLGQDPTSPNAIGGWPHFSGALGGALPDYSNWTKVVNGVATSTTRYATSDNVDDAIDWIREQGDASWFLWLAFNAPHTPFHRPPNDLHDYDSIAETGQRGSRDHYEAMVQAMDTELGRLLEAVDLTETTLIFMGDNGTPGHVIQFPFTRTHAKDTLYEGGIRVPLIITGAAVDPSLAGQTYEGILHVCDLYSTILELFGVAVAEAVPAEVLLDSNSFLSLLETGTYARTPAEVMCLKASASGSGSGDRTLIGPEFKYIAFEDGSEALYKIDVNPREADNLLESGLNATQQAAYNQLSTNLASYQSVPVIASLGLDESGRVNIEIGWYANASLKLERSPDLSGWSNLGNADIIDNGGTTITLVDPTPLTTNAFYIIHED